MESSSVGDGKQGDKVCRSSSAMELNSRLQPGKKSILKIKTIPFEFLVFTSRITSAEWKKLFENLFLSLNLAFFFDVDNGRLLVPIVTVALATRKTLSTTSR